MPQLLTKPTLDELAKEANEHDLALEELRQMARGEEFLNSAVAQRRRRIVEEAEKVARQLAKN